MRCNDAVRYQPHGFTMIAADWVEDVIHFWFNELEPSRWFTRDDGVDARVRQRFTPLYERVAAMQADEHASPRQALAAVITVDQFPRNMFRNTPRAFATDALALAISAAAIERGFDQELETKERSFLYMPWQHSEDRDVQARSVQLFEQLGDAVGLDYARQHKEIIDRFGRFPHRNRVLGRTSTAAELASRLLAALLQRAAERALPTH